MVRSCCPRPTFQTQVPRPGSVHQCWSYIRRECMRSCRHQTTHAAILRCKSQAKNIYHHVITIFLASSRWCHYCGCDIAVGDHREYLQRKMGVENVDRPCLSTSQPPFGGGKAPTRSSMGTDFPVRYLGLQQAQRYPNHAAPLQTSQAPAPLCMGSYCPAAASSVRL